MQEKGWVCGSPRAAADGKAVIKPRHCYCAMTDSPSLQEARRKDLFTHPARDGGEACSLCRSSPRFRGVFRGSVCPSVGHGPAAGGARDGGSGRAPPGNPSSLGRGEGKTWALKQRKWLGMPGTVLCGEVQGLPTRSWMSLQLFPGVSSSLLLGCMSCPTVKPWVLGLRLLVRSAKGEVSLVSLVLCICI